MTIKQLTILIIICLCSTLQANTLLTNEIIEIVTIKGKLSKETHSIISNLSLNSEIGNRLQKRLIQKDIETIYSLGLIKKIKAYSEIKNAIHHLIFECTENPIIETITFKGNTLFSDQELSTLIQHKINNPLNFNLIEKDKTILTSHYTKKGYDFIRINAITFNQNRKELQVELEEGIIENIQFNGLTKLSPTILLREFQQQPGDVFNSKQLRKDRETLLKLGYFSNISPPKLNIVKDKGNIKVNFDVTEKKINSINLGIEQEETKFVGFVKHINNHNFILSDTLSSKVQINYENKNVSFKNYSITYKQPWTFNKYKLSTSISHYNKEQEELLNATRVNSNRQGENIKFTYPWTKQFKSSITYKNEHISSADDTNTIDQAYNLNSLALELNYYSIKNPYNPNKGIYGNIEFEKGNNLGLVSLGGLSFSRVLSTLAIFYPITEKSVFANRIQAGIFYPNEEHISTFETEYFVIGGSTSLRGYNEISYPFSGARKILINTEYRYNITNKFQLITFLDFGNAFDTQLIFNNLNTGKGIGVRYMTPVGAIRFDYAIGKDHTFLHFGLGQLF